MVINKAIEHFKWKLQNNWKPTESDIKALDSIIDFVNDKHKEQINDHQLYAKLYITYYGQLLRYYSATVFDKEPQKELHKQLDKPLERIIKEFTDLANQIEVENKMKLSGITDSHPVNQKDKGKFSIEMLEPEMTLEEAERNLTSLINLSINEYK